MRKITEMACRAFFAGDNFNRANTRVESDNGETRLYLHGHCIAKRNSSGLFVNSCGWETNTTKERLNGVLSWNNSGHIYQHDWVWYYTPNWDSEPVEFPSAEWFKIN